MVIAWSFNGRLMVIKWSAVRPPRTEDGAGRSAAGRRRPARRAGPGAVRQGGEDGDAGLVRAPRGRGAAGARGPPIMMLMLMLMMIMMTMMMMLMMMMMMMMKTQNGHNSANFEATTSRFLHGNRSK